MTDYTRATGNSATMMIRDTGSTIEFWINSNNSSTWTDHLNWSGTVNGVGVSGSYSYKAGSGWQRFGSWGVSYSQNITFGIGSTGTSGFGGPTSFTVSINRSTVPQAPGIVNLSQIGPYSVHAYFVGGGDGNSPILEWQIGYGTDPNATQLYMGGSEADIGALTPGTTYYFWARGRNAQGWGPWGPRNSATTLNVPDPPSAPVISSITQISAVASFTPNGDGGASITAYQIGYGINSSAPTTIISATSPQSITNLSPGITHYFWSRAQNSVGWSPWSAVTVANTIAGARIKVGTIWKDAVPYIKVNGTWKVARPWGRVAGVWKEST